MLVSRLRLSSLWVCCVFVVWLVLRGLARVVRLAHLSARLLARVELLRVDLLLLVAPLPSQLFEGLLLRANHEDLLSARRVREDLRSRS